MSGLRLAAAALLAAALSGCVLFTDARREIDSTPVWRVTPATGVFDGEYGRTDDSDSCSFAFRVIRYRDGIGVKATVRDNRIVTEGCPTGAVSCASWNFDTLQCYFDGDNDRAHDARKTKGVHFGGEYVLVANGSAQSDWSSAPKGFGKAWTGTVAVRPASDGGYELDYDLWFSWPCLGLVRPPSREEDVTFGFNICVHDDDDGGRCDRALFWKGTPDRPYRDESGFASITLKGVR